MKSLKTNTRLDHKIDLIVRFKRFLNIQLDRPMYLYDENLHGREELFNMWIFQELKIIDLESYLKSKEVTL